MNSIFRLENLARKSLIIYMFARFLFIFLFRGILYEKEANGFKKLKIKKKITIIDIGANDGLSSSFFMSIFRNSKIYIFEPLKKELNFKHFKNNNKMKIFNVALGSKLENNKLNIPFVFIFFKKFYLSAYSTISKKKNYIYNLNSSLKTFLFYKSIKNKIVDVQIKKLDDYKLKPNIIKLDVEGFENDVIKGSLVTIKKNLPILYIERPTYYTKNILKKIGYKFYYFDHKKDKFIETKKNKINFRNYFFIPINKKYNLEYFFKC